MVARVGYTQTEIGPLPEDWAISPLRSLTTQPATYGVVKAGSFLSKGTPMVRGGDIKDGRINTDLPLISDAKHAEYRRTALAAGDVLIALVGYPGESAVVPQSLAGANISRAVGLLRPGSGLTPAYLSCYLNAPSGRAEFLRPGAGSAQLVVNLRDLNLLRVPLPPTKAEQEAIAMALGDADALIESLEKLIAKKHQIKQGVMQELLTGKTRLPGFGGEWSVRPLGEVMNSCSSGATPYRGRPDYYKGSVKWITSGELNYGLITDTVEHVSEQAVNDTNLKIHPTGTFLMAITGLEAAGTRGACGIVGSPATTNQSCMAIYPTEELKAEYLFHYYVYRGDELALRYCQGTKQQSYTASLVKLLPIALPPTSQEQASIASLLSDMDTEITALRTKLAKVCQIKQGMMQELLTGRIRLV